jgi:hypothetical protein
MILPSNGLRACGWNYHPERGSAFRRVLDRHFAAVRLDDCPDDTEAKTYTFGLAGHERFEQALAYERGDPRTGVADADGDAGIARIMCAHAHLAPFARLLRDGLEGVDDEVEQRLLHLCAITHDAEGRFHVETQGNLSYGNVAR